MKAIERHEDIPIPFTGFLPSCTGNSLPFDYATCHGCYKGLFGHSGQIAFLAVQQKVSNRNSSVRSFVSSSICICNLDAREVRGYEWLQHHHLGSTRKVLRLVVSLADGRMPCQPLRTPITCMCVAQVVRPSHMHRCIIILGSAIAPAMRIIHDGQWRPHEQQQTLQKIIITHTRK